MRYVNSTGSRFWKMSGFVAREVQARYQVVASVARRGSTTVVKLLRRTFVCEPPVPSAPNVAPGLMFSAVCSCSAVVLSWGGTMSVSNDSSIGTPFSARYDSPAARTSAKVWNPSGFALPPVKRFDCVGEPGLSAFTGWLAEKIAWPSCASQVSPASSASVTRRSGQILAAKARSRTAPLKTPSLSSAILVRGTLKPDSKSRFGTP